MPACPINSCGNSIRSRCLKQKDGTLCRHFRIGCRLSACCRYLYPHMQELQDQSKGLAFFGAAAAQAAALRSDEGGRETQSSAVAGCSEGTLCDSGNAPSMHLQAAMAGERVHDQSLQCAGFPTRSIRVSRSLGRTVENLLRWRAVPKLSWQVWCQPLRTSAANVPAFLPECAPSRGCAHA